ncbi:AbrB/MazE/SpoVT family DNA-binding domain-containing protein [Candidatus Pacearchaeota archaeon]|nr:AbrB/MazE/SpoVT family DNA-binding domain-containing protein [Candidatus Pacearchaeota archaeon]
MKRKIIRQGHNTLTITLPTEWTKKLNLNAGDEIDLNEDNGSLVINGKQNNGFKTATIDISGFTVPLIWRYFQSAYREGCDEIILKFDKNQKDFEGAYNYYSTHFEYTKFGEKPITKPGIEMITELVNRFINMEIIEQGEGFCIIREMGEISSKEFDNSLRRIFLLIIDLFDKIISLLKNNKIGDISVCKTLHAMDINVDRFIDYCCRINNKIKDSSFQKNKPIMFSTLFLLELLGDEFKYIGAHLAKSQKNVDEIVHFARTVKEHFEMYYHLFYKFDRESEMKFGVNDFKLYNEHFKWKESKNKDATSIRQHLMQVSKFTWCLNELRIEMEF